MPYEKKSATELEYIAQRCVSSGKPELSGTEVAYTAEEVYADYKEDTPAIYQELAQLPFHLIINTSFDHYMKEALMIFLLKSPILV